jgi:hypothetical protein
MTTEATRNVQNNTSEGTLFLAFELSEKTWKLGFTTGPDQKPRERTVTARDQERVLDEITSAKRRLGLPEEASKRLASYLEQTWTAASVAPERAENPIRNSGRTSTSNFCRSCRITPRATP